jgi:Uma2 family endonuclease
MQLLKTQTDKELSYHVPSEIEWDEMTKSERIIKENEIINALEQASSLMGETTIHFNARSSASEVLKRYYSGKGQKVFIASDLHTLYPNETAFYPDLLVVFDVEDHHRSCWNVHREKKGLDFVLEIISKSSRRHDQVEKLNLFARLKIPEYFMYDPDKHILRGYCLRQDEQHAHYHEIKPNTFGHVFSKILGLDLTIDNYKLRFASQDGLEILFGDELVGRLNDKLLAKESDIANALLLVEEEIKLKEEETKLKEAAELKIQRLEEELKSLKKRV